MRAWAKGLIHLVLAIGLGTGAGAGASALLTEHRERQLAELAADPTGIMEPRDRVREALAELRVDGVYVAPDGRYLLDEEGERTVEQAVADSEIPVYVIVWARDQEIGHDELHIEEQLSEALGPDRAAVFIWEGPQEGSVVLVPHGGSLNGFYGGSDFVGDPAEVLPEAFRAVPEAQWYDGQGSDYWDGTSGGIAAGVLIGSGALFVLLGGAWVVTRAAGIRLPGRWMWREDG